MRVGPRKVIEKGKQSLENNTHHFIGYKSETEVFAKLTRDGARFLGDGVAELVRLPVCRLELVAQLCELVLEG